MSDWIYRHWIKYKIIYDLVRNLLGIKTLVEQQLLVENECSSLGVSSAGVGVTQLQMQNFSTKHFLYHLQFLLLSLHLVWVIKLIQ